MLEKKQLYQEKIHTDVDDSYMMTKTLSKTKLELYKASIGLGIYPQVIDEGKNY